MSGPRVHNGREWIPISTTIESSDVKPVEPVLDGDGKIFVSIVSYRDGERCGETLRSLFQNAKHPDNIIVGLYEQNAPEDKFCIEQYCENFGVKTIKRVTMRKDVVKIVALDDDIRKKCPHIDQVRLVAYHHIQAKGPMLARSMIRKVLGNEEFCMQIDAHTDFASGWDELAMSEWKKVNNEFGILSNVPAPKADKALYINESDSKFNEVPRQCALRFLDNGFPDYTKPADGKVAGLEKPLLGHGWSAAFSFAKCHLEESAPYDNFAWYAMPIEQFSRFARFWTRGYDVYTPTRNIVFHDYEKQANGHGDNEWFKRQRDRFRQSALVRVKTILQIPGGESDTNDQANLGIFGLGKRRTLQQLNAFAGIHLRDGKANHGDQCSGHEWVPYDVNISPTENLFNNPDNLDPQPEYPLRTNLLYYHPPATAIINTIVRDNGHSSYAERVLPMNDGSTSNNSPSMGVLLFLWILGLLVWFLLCTPNSFVGNEKQSRQAAVRKKSSTDIYKDV